MALSGAVGRRVRGRTGRHSGAWGAGQGRQTDRNEATVSHTTGRGPIQAKKMKQEEALLPKAQTPGPQDHRTTPRGRLRQKVQKRCAEREDEGRGWEGEEVKRERQGEDRKEEKKGRTCRLPRGCWRRSGLTASWVRHWRETIAEKQPPSQPGLSILPGPCPHLTPKELWLACHLWRPVQRRSQCPAEGRAGWPYTCPPGGLKQVRKPPKPGFPQMLGWGGPHRVVVRI